MRRAEAAAALLAALALGGCASKNKFSPGEDAYPDASVVPPDIHTVADAVPKSEPRARYGNPKSYEVAGERYFVLGSAAGYKERGRASWYGTKFHGRRTSSGEAYDMFQMTAAHKTLPLPTYVRVTNLDNGKSAVVRVNDRGPFHQGRIIDLSYAAAARLDVLEKGSVPVEVEAIDPSAAPVTAGPHFLEVGEATDDAIYAVAVREAVDELGLAAVEIRSEERGAGVWYRVLAGPFADPAAQAAARRALAGRDLPARDVEE